MTIKKIVATWDYCDERGTLLYQKVRYEPKGFSQRRPDGRGGWISNLDGTRRVLLRLNELQGCQEVVLCEGEKDADRLRALGVPATTTSGGAKRQRGRNWRPEYTDQLIAAGVERLLAVPDNDEAGRVYANDALTACHAAGVTTTTVVLPNLGPKGDVSDWLDAGHTKDDLVALLQTAPDDNPDIGGHAAGDRDDRVEDTDAERTGRTPARRTSASWPAAPAPAAMHGLFGDLVKLIAPHTEADPVALLLQIVVAFGNIIGRGAYFMVGATRHNMNLFVLIVGDTAKSRKGTSLQDIFRFFRALGERWASSCVLTGLSSGEGPIWAVCDPIRKQKPVKAKGRIVDYETVIEDHGIEDKRLLVVESEFASTLKVLKREGNTLSPTMRQAWDGGVLNTLTKNAPATATGAHISIIGQITQHDLRFGDTEAANGFGNRFLIACVRRSKFLPEGGCLDEEDMGPVLDRLRAAMTFATEVEGGRELHRDDEARGLWCSGYRKLSSPQPGVLGTMTVRAEAQVTRLSCLYALGDASPVVRVEHLGLFRVSGG